MSNIEDHIGPAEPLDPVYEARLNGYNACCERKRLANGGELGEADERHCRKIWNIDQYE